MTDPLYSLSKIKAMIVKIKRDEDDNRRLSDRAFNGLTSKEKFSYVLLHGEDFSQNCEPMPQVADEHKKIFRYFPSPFGDEAVWSDRQRAFLDNNPTKVIDMLKETLAKRQRVGTNLKQTVAYVKAKSLIPQIKAIYLKDHKDHDILTLFMLMMDDAKYKPFLSSTIYKTIYSEEASWQATIPFNKANEKTILDLATRFAVSKP